MAKDITTDPKETLDQALTMGSLGYKIIPIPSGQKFPKGLTEWQKRATDDEVQITDWWGSGEKGIGWAMGLQPCGSYLVAIDVDIADGKVGRETIKALIEKYGMGEDFKATISQRTGSGGYHFIFECSPSLEITNGILGEHVDIRGEGGFIVCAPSIHPNGKPYEWGENAAPWEQQPGLLPWQLAAILTAEKETVARVVAPPINGVKHEASDSPADWVRDNCSIATMLSAAGWDYLGDKGGDSSWRRPGKTKGEQSGVLHGDAPLVIWSTSAPMEFWRCGRDNADGSRSLSPLDVYAAINHSGDIRAASSHIRKTLMPRPESPLPSLNTNAGGEVSGPGVEAGAGLNLPPEFWEARPYLTHIRDAAWSRLAVPDAVLASVLSRFAAMIPPNLLLPGIIGSEATFDYMTCVVAASSGGKSISNDVAADLLPGTTLKQVMFDAPIGSGEGLIQGFMGADPEDKKQSYKHGKFKSIHFTVDEGTALLEQQSRKGTTIVATLCSAWSGKTLGQMNAGIETTRLVPARKRRIAATVNIQTKMAPLMFEAAIVGLPSRILFAWAHGEFPDHDPDWPGPLPVAVPSGWGHITTTTMKYAPEIEAELKATRRAVANGSLVLGDLDGHIGLIQLKLAGILALMDERESIENSDWELAKTVVISSTAVRDHIHEVKKQADLDKSVTIATARGIQDDIAFDVAERRKIARLRESIIAKIPEEGIGENALRKATCSSGTKHRFAPALQSAVDDGAIEKRGELWNRA